MTRQKLKFPFCWSPGPAVGDDWVVTGEQLKEIYDDIPSDKVMLRRKETVHNEVLYTANGYVTAWFRWQLQGDEHAAAAFTGDAPEILQNEQYQDQKISIGKVS